MSLTQADWPADPVDDVAAIVAAVPGVAGLTAGPFGDLLTYLPGRRVVGVRHRGGRLDLAVVLAWGASADVVARLIRARLAGVDGLADDEVHVLVADVEEPPEPVSAEQAATSTEAASQAAGVGAR